MKWLVLFAVFTVPTHAQVIVNDPANYTESLKNNIHIVKQTVEDAKRYEQLVREYARQLEILDQMRGDFEMGDLLNDSKYRRARRAIRILWDSNEELFSVNSEVAERLGIKKPQAEVINDSLVKKEAAAGLMEQAGNMTEEAEELGSRIDSSASLKAAQDLNNRLQVQEQHINLKVLEAAALLVEALADESLERERGRIADAAMAKGK